MFKNFIKTNLINKGGGLNIHKISIQYQWVGFEKEKGIYNNSDNRIQYLYDSYWEIDNPPKCDCGANLKFRNFKRGYDGCELSFNCDVYKNKASMRNRKVTYDMDWFKYNFKEVDEYQSEFESVNNYFNANEIQISKCRYILEWIRNYIKYEVSDWSNRIDITLKSIDDGSLNKKDVLSEKSMIIRFGDQWEVALKDRLTNQCGSKYDACMKRSNGDKEQAAILLEEWKLKSGHTIESYIYRHGEIEGKEKYDEYWKNTTFAISKERFKTVYGDDWEKYYNERIQLHRDAVLTLTNYDPNTSNCTEDEFNKKRKLKYKKASESKKKYNAINNLISEGKNKEEIIECLDKRWSRSLKNFIKKYGDIKGRKKYKEFCENTGFTLPYYIKKYGEIEGNRKYDEVREKIFIGISNSKYKRYSKESNNFIEEILSLLESNGIDIGNVMYGENEKGIYNKDERVGYLIDLYFEKYNVAFEFNGITFHPNPSWNEQQIESWGNPLSIDCENKIQRDKIKIEYLNKVCDKVFVYYSDENKNEVLYDILNYFKERLNVK